MVEARRNEEMCLCFVFAAAAAAAATTAAAAISAAAAFVQVVSGANAQAMMNRAAALVKWEGIMSEKTRIKVRP